MSPKIERLEGQSPEKRRNILIGALALIFLAAIIIFSGRGQKAADERETAPPPVAPLGPDKARE